MIGQYLSNKNESTTVSILQKILELNKAQMTFEPKYPPAKTKRFQLLSVRVSGT
jgi:hypothetical protein